MLFYFLLDVNLMFLLMLWGSILYVLLIWREVVTCIILIKNIIQDIVIFKYIPILQIKFKHQQKQQNHLIIYPSLQTTYLYHFKFIKDSSPKRAASNQQLSQSKIRRKPFYKSICKTSTSLNFTLTIPTQAIPFQ